MSSEKLQLVIDGEDTYRETDNVLYFHPSKIGMIQYLRNNQFSSCLIKNCDVQDMSSIYFVYIREKLLTNSKCEVIINQPVAVMQEFEAKQIEANATLAGFNDIQTKNYSYKNEKTGKKINTLSISFIKPDKKC